MLRICIGVLTQRPQRERTKTLRLHAAGVRATARSHAAQSTSEGLPISDMKKQDFVVNVRTFGERRRDITASSKDNLHALGGEKLEALTGHCTHAYYWTRLFHESTRVIACLSLKPKSRLLGRISTVSDAGTGCSLQLKCVARKQRIGLLHDCATDRVSSIGCTFKCQPRWKCQLRRWEAQAQDLP
jgi:hypothetical protein